MWCSIAVVRLFPLTGMGSLPPGSVNITLHKVDYPEQFEVFVDSARACAICYVYAKAIEQGPWREATLAAMKMYMRASVPLADVDGEAVPAADGAVQLPGFFCRRGQRAGHGRPPWTCSGTTISVLTF
jgi:hypothetical protein